MKAFVLLILALLASPAWAMPEILQSEGGWQKRGSGELSWFGLRVYRATLWTKGENADRNAAPLALTLEYRREIRGARIARSSIDEMRRLGAPETSLARWDERLRALFPDVAPGDQLTGVHLASGATRFYFGDRYLGEIGEPEFSRHFFGIWLDARTRAPEVREALLQESRP